MKFQVFTAFILASFATALPSNPAPRSDNDLLDTRAVNAAANFNFTEDFAAPLNKLFDVIDNIPDDVLAAGDAAVDAWLQSQGIREPAAPAKRSIEVEERSVDIEERDELVERDWWQVTKCVASIVQVLATTAIPAGKLLKIKKLIGDLGGVKTAVELMLKATSRAEKLKVGGEALVQLSAELLGINMVKSNCF